MTIWECAIRSEVRPDDRKAVDAIVASTGYFNPAEQAVAEELVDEYLARGEASGYRFLFAEDPATDAAVLGYACYGPVAGTESSHDLYWIAVHERHRGKGIGRRLLDATLAAVRAEGGTRLYAETSSRELYRPTHEFYLKNGFRLEARLPDFYATGDDKLIFMRPVAGTRCKA